MLVLGIFSMLVSFAVFAEEPAIDKDEAVKLARSKHCLRCHGVSKQKEGPTYQKIAAFYKNNKDAEDALYEHITTSPKVKLTDGHKETHKAILDKKPEEIRNLVRWILAQ